jgi:hypothetical protein
MQGRRLRLSVANQVIKDLDLRNLRALAFVALLWRLASAGSRHHPNCGHGGRGEKLMGDSHHRGESSYRLQIRSC